MSILTLNQIKMRTLSKDKKRIKSYSITMFIFIGLYFFTMYKQQGNLDSFFSVLTLSFCGLIVIVNLYRIKRIEEYIKNVDNCIKVCKSIIKINNDVKEYLDKRSLEPNKDNISFIISILMINENYEIDEAYFKMLNKIVFKNENIKENFKYFEKIIFNILEDYKQYKNN